MTVDSLAAVRTRAPGLQRVAAIGCGCLMAGAAALVAVNDPSAPGSRFPACGFHAATGLWCPGCGLTRGTHHLLRGDVVGALSSNVFTPFVLGAIVTAWVTWTLTAFGRRVSHPATRIPAWSGPVLATVLVAFGVVRNLPFGWSRALAP
ncbi:MAG: DUF2752 domain-containing protein [Acidimicrobiales bacterium]